MDALPAVALETERRLSTLEIKMETAMTDLKEIKTMLTALVESSNKTKGFWAGMIAAGTTMGAAIGGLVSYIFHQALNR